MARIRFVEMDVDDPGLVTGGTNGTEIDRRQVTVTITKQQ